MKLIVLTVMILLQKRTPALVYAAAMGYMATINAALQQLEDVNATDQVID